MAERGKGNISKDNVLTFFHIESVQPSPKYLEFPRTMWGLEGFVGLVITLRRMNALLLNMAGPADIYKPRLCAFECGWPSRHLQT